MSVPSGKARWLLGFRHAALARNLPFFAAVWSTTKGRDSEAGSALHIAVQHVSKSFGETSVLRDVNARIP